MATTPRDALDPEKGNLPVGKRGPGRPAIWDDARKKAFLKHVANGMTREQGCKLVGASTSSLKRAVRVDPIFKGAMHRAELEGMSAAAACFTKAAKKNWKAAMQYLARLDPARWGSKQEFTLAPSASGGADQQTVLAMYTKLGVDNARPVATDDNTNNGDGGDDGAGVPAVEP